MSATGTPTGSLRLVPLFHLLVIIFSLPGQSHTSVIPEEGAAVNCPSYEELTTSLVVNQLAILQVMQDASNATSEKCRQNEARLQNEATAQAARLENEARAQAARLENEARAQAARLDNEAKAQAARLENEARAQAARLENEARAQATRLEEALRLHLERVEEVVEAGQQRRTQEVLEAISTKINTTVQDTLTIAAEKCRQNEARLEEALRLHLARVEEVIAAGQQHRTQELLEAISTKISTTIQDTLRTPPACEEGWVRLDSSCYLINSTAKLNWSESRDYCLSRNSELVKITSEAEDSFIRHQLIDSVWIALTDLDSEGVFVWTDGSQPGYTGWKKGEPNDQGGREDCGMLYKERHYDWNDHICSNKYGVVCEKPLEPVPS